MPRCRPPCEPRWASATASSACPSALRTRRTSSPSYGRRWADRGSARRRSGAWPCLSRHRERPCPLALQPGRGGADSQQVAPREQAGELAGFAVDDRHAAYVGRRHPVGEMADQLIRIADEYLADVRPLLQRLSLGPALPRPAQHVRARHHADNAPGIVDHRIALVTLDAVLGLNE